MAVRAALGAECVPSRAPVFSMACFALGRQPRDNFGHRLPLHQSAWLLFPSDRQDNHVERSLSVLSPALMDLARHTSLDLGECLSASNAEAFLLSGALNLLGWFVASALIALDTYLARGSLQPPVPQKSTCQCLLCHIAIDLFQSATHSEEVFRHVHSNFEV